jgi:hypothetical protein
MFAFGSKRVSVCGHLVPVQGFFRSESGAVTVDWVVLTAAIVGLGLGAIFTIQTGSLSLGNGLGATMNNATVQPLGTLGASGPSG